MLMHEAIRILRDEHRSLSAVLQAMQHLARKAVEPGVRPRFEVFRAMIHYIDAFPERLHHPKEDEHLFAALERRAPEARVLLDELRAEHVEGAQRVRALERALAAFEADGPRRGAQFVEAVNGYAEFHWNHMSKEEKQVLPLAERALTEEDWRRIGVAFAGNEDPIADLREQEFEQLYARIVGLAPAPIGLGERWATAP
jgi:hemerythrin-like domain-containing protein